MLTLTPSAFFLRVDRPTAQNPQPGQPKTLLLSPQQSLDPEAYYAWFYDGSPLWTILGAAAMVIVMLAGVMFPLWPVKLRIGVWYLSIAVLVFIAAMIVLAIVRLIFWCITVMGTKRAIWIFPNLFEDVGFVSLCFTRVSISSFLSTHFPTAPPYSPAAFLASFTMQADTGAHRGTPFSPPSNPHNQTPHPLTPVRIVRARLGV